MSFAFIPRNVAKKTHSISSSSLTSATENSVNSKGPVVDLNLSAVISPALQADEGSGAEEIATLVVLTLTDYALWTDGNLRRRVEQTTEDGNVFLPLRYVLKHSPLIQEQHDSQLNFKVPSESTIVKALRKHAKNEIEVRMVLSGPTWSNWGSSSADNDKGMYEVRRKKGASYLIEGAEVYTRDYWAKRTVYIENIPPTYRSMQGVFKFVRNTYTSPNHPTVEGISFPSHHLDVDTDTSSIPTTSRPKSRHKCKGFAFIVFSSVDEVRRFCMTWNWERSQSHSITVETNASLPYTPSLQINKDVNLEAKKYGFRALPKARWDALKDEYKVWRQELLDQVLAEQDYIGEEINHRLYDQWEEDEGESRNSGDSHPIQNNIPLTPSSSSTDFPSSLTSSSPYPPNCLVFIRNIHMGTNKTTLRTLFSKALMTGGVERGIEYTQSSEDDPQCQNIDYVDFTKGMFTCYLRFSSPSKANALQSYFANHRIVQSTALDDTGIEISIEAGIAREAGEKHIEVEIVQGKKEEIYWEKVPMKVRQEAVRKAFVNTNVSPSSIAASALSDTVSTGSSHSTLLTTKKKLTSNSSSGPSADSSRSQEWSASVSNPLSYPQPYPTDCLLFARNVHPGTNKTTLRALFNNVLSKKGGNSNTENPNIRCVIDYVDYTKGTDSCHIRLASSSDAHFLVQYFKEKSVMQNLPLDDGNSEIGGARSIGFSSTERYIAVEFVQGTREKIYWEKVPLKVREKAVLQALNDSSEHFISSSMVSACREPLITTSGPKSKASSMSSKKRALASANASVGLVAGEKYGDRSALFEEGIMCTTAVGRKKQKKI